MARRGRRGGLATLAKFGRDHYRELGRRGGTQTKAKHGVDHLRRAGRKGYHALVEKYFDGDEEAFRKWFVTAGLAAQDPFPGNGAFAPAIPFPYGSNPPGKLSWQDWEDIWDDHFERGAL